MRAIKPHELVKVISDLQGRISTLEAGLASEASRGDSAEKRIAALELPAPPAKKTKKKASPKKA